MAPPFAAEEFDRRLLAVRDAMARRDLDALLIGDPSNQNWLTGYDASGLQGRLEDETDLESFFAQAPQLNPLRQKITGVVCGVRVEDIEEKVMREIRYLDKMIDELQELELQERSCGSRDSRSRVAGAGIQEEFWRRGVAGAGFQEKFWSLGAKSFEFSSL